MRRSKPGKKGTILISAGVLLLVISLSLTGYNLWDEWRAASFVNGVMEELSDAVPAPQAAWDGGMSDLAQASDLRIPDYILAPEMEMPTLSVDGEEYIGYIVIPSLSLELPVMSGWSYPKLKQSPCRYSGSAYQDDLVICAHNYERHFGGLKDLQLGDEVYFIDVDGNLFTYSVAELTQLDPEDVEEMVSSDWDLSLFTCTLGGQFRVTVRCERV